VKIFLHKDLKKKLKKIPAKVRDKFFERLELFIANPNNSMLNNHSVSKIFPGRRSINITGDYRAIFREYDYGIIFTDINTHSELYG
jgi:mRNA-degrading endonuclease YafQ of YafQ-DinJ toxin-antitoxin module